MMSERMRVQRKKADIQERRLTQQHHLIPGQPKNWVPSIINEVVQSDGQPLDSATRVSMESRFGHDFSKVRVHTDARAAEAARQIDARAFTYGTDIAFNTGEYTPDTAQGHHLITHELTHVVQQADGRAIGYVQRAPLSQPDAEVEVKEVFGAEMTDEVLAGFIMDTQLGILDAWDSALDIFHIVLTSASDKSTKPDFLKVIRKFFRDDVMRELISKAKIPGAGKAFSFLLKLEEELDRTIKARESATLRSFCVDYKQVIADLKLTWPAKKATFLTDVEKTAKQVTEDIASQSEYGLMRMNMIDLAEKLKFHLEISTSENLFRKLSEEWIRQTTIPSRDAWGTAAYVQIRIEEDFSIRDAKIKGPGGQKIAEQMLEDSPEGVDVFNLKVRRIILYYKGGNKEYSSAIVKLDENGNLVNEGGFAQGNYDLIYRILIHRGLPPTKNLSGFE